MAELEKLIFVWKVYEYLKHQQSNLVAYQNER